jgi:hypothetical protein
MKKPYIEVSYHERGCLDFKGNDIGFWLLKRQLSNLGPHIWQACAYPISNNFCKYGLVGCHKNGFLFYQCMEKNLWGDYKLRAGCRMDHSNFQRYRTLKNGHTWGYINFLGVHAYIAFLDIWMFWIKIWTMVTSNTLQTFWAKIPTSRSSL